MDRIDFVRKVLFLAVVLLFCVSLSSFAGTATLDQNYLSNSSFLGNGIAELSIDHSQLYAMASRTKKTQGSTAEKINHRSAMETWHKYLGYGTVVLAGVTAATNSDEDLHESVAYATAASAISTVLTGYLAHRDRFDTYDGLLSKDNLHIILGTVGAALLTTAVAIADEGRESSHSGLGVAGGVLMTLGVIDIKW